MGLLFCGIENSWNLSKRYCVATSFSRPYHFPINSKNSLGDLHRFSIALSSVALKCCVQEIPRLVSTSYFLR